MRSQLVALAVLVVTCTGPGTGHAFKIGNAAAGFCHEQITFNGFLDSQLGQRLGLSQRKFDADSDEVFVRLADYMAAQINGAGPKNDAQRLIITTLFVGVRYPDQAGFAIHDLRELRAIHLAEEGQEEHFLRAVDQDWAEGDAQAVASGRQFILDVIDTAYDTYFNDQDAQTMIEVKFWLEYYGTVDVLVWAPMFYLGRAIHALQDSFTHAIRSEDTTRIYSVLNFVDGLSTRWSEARDGARHSDFVDDCTRPEVAPLVESATQASSELMQAAVLYFATGDRESVEQVLDRWLTYEPGCGYNEGYCDSPWVEYTRRLTTEPLLGCTIEAVPHRPTSYQPLRRR